MSPVNACQFKEGKEYAIYALLQTAYPTCKVEYVEEPK